MTGPRLTTLAQSLPATVPFVGPETQERQFGRPFRARLGANECGFGPARSVIDAIARAGPDAWMYGDPENHDLRRALADQIGVDPASVIVGEGIDGLLGYLVRLLVDPGDAVVTSAGAYPTFNYHVAGFGGALHMVPYRGDHEDPEALVAKARETEAKAVYFANPDNPMGTWHGPEAVDALLDGLPDGCLLILDEAYVEFAPEAELLPLNVLDPRLIRMRTFSKAHGMAGLRVGYGIGHPELITAFNKVRNHFGMSRLSQAAALASLADAEALASTISRTARARQRIEEIARSCGLEPITSYTNFVAIDCGADGSFAKKVLDALNARGVFVRMPFVAPQDRCIRISAGPDAELDIFAEALPQALAQARGN